MKTPMNEHASTIRVATFTAAAGHFDELVAAARTNAHDATVADGCFGAQVLCPDDRSDVVTVISRWRDRDCLDRFLGAHEKIAHKAVGGFISEPVAATHYAALPG